MEMVKSSVGECVKIRSGKANPIMEVDRADGRTPNQRRPVVCTRGVLHRAHGSASWAQGDTKVIAAVYGPKAGTKKNENPEKACIEVHLEAENRTEWETGEGI